MFLMTVTQSWKQICRVTHEISARTLKLSSLTLLSLLFLSHFSSYLFSYSNSNSRAHLCFFLISLLLLVEDASPHSMRRLWPLQTGILCGFVPIEILSDILHHLNLSKIRKSRHANSGAPSLLDWIITIKQLGWISLSL